MTEAERRLEKLLPLVCEHPMDCCRHACPECASDVVKLLLRSVAIGAAREKENSDG